MQTLYCNWQRDTVIHTDLHYIQFNSVFHFFNSRKQIQLGPTKEKHLAQDSAHMSL